jgi:subtilisin family serine protease
MNKKKIPLIFTLVFLIFCIISAGSSQELKGDIKVMVKLENPSDSYKSSLFGVKSNNALLDYEVKESFGDIMVLEVSKQELEELKNNNNLVVEVVKPIHAFLQESVPLINASVVWPINLSSQNITGINETICILDTGINFSHPDLIGKNKTQCNVNCIEQSPCDVNCSSYDDNGHGTHVAGIVSANGGIKGVSIQTGLIGVKVLNASGEDNTDALFRGMQWCIDNATTYNISVISMSLGTSELFNDYCDGENGNTADLIDNAISKNISIIAATGNNGSTTHISSPACIKNVTAVGATNKNDAMYFNRNNLTDLLAPGVNINSTMIPNPYTVIADSCGTGKSYCSLNGTSMSTPHVAGAFALIRQFFRLQNSRIPTPFEIQDILNKSGVLINDEAESGYNFTRIDVYSAIKSIDISNPDAYLLSPINDSLEFDENVSFNCSANDVQLKNITLYIWNSTSLFNNTEVENISGTNNQTQFNITNMPSGNYKWNCLVYDENSSFSFSQSNYTLKISPIEVKLNTPLNNLHTKLNKTYNCSAQAEILENITFYFWNSTNQLEYNETKDITGTSNYSVFEHNFTKEGNYTWNCKAFNKDNISTLNDVNYTIYYDLTNPSLTLLEPFPTNQTKNSVEKIFYFNVTESNLANCSLIINGGVSVTNSSITPLQNQSIKKTFTPNTYNWSVTCTDLSGNQNTSAIKFFKITAEPSDSDDSDTTPTTTSPSTPSLTSKIYSISKEEFITGYAKEIIKDEKIKFTHTDDNEHSLTLKKVTSDSVEVEIRSSPIKVTLNVGESKKLNLASTTHFDFFVKLVGIKNQKADIIIKSIYEEIPLPPQQNQTQNITTTNQTDGTRKFSGEIFKNVYEKIKGKINKKLIYYVVGGIVGLLILGGIVFLIYKKRNRIVGSNYASFN